MLRRELGKKFAITEEEVEEEQPATYDLLQPARTDKKRQKYKNIERKKLITAIAKCDFYHELKFGRK